MKRIISVLLSLALMLLFCLSLIGCKGRVSVRKKFYDGYFHTVCEFRDVSGAGERAFLEKSELVEDELSLCHKLFDIRNEYSGIINLKTINDRAGDGEWLSVDERIIELLTLSKRMYALTDGNINIAMGGVISIWKAASESAEGGKPYIPEREALIAAGQHTSIDALEIDEVGGRVRLCDPDVSLDVGAIAKGYCAERVGKLLREYGTVHFLLDFGGNLVIGEKRDGSGTTTGIRNPADDDSMYARIVELKNTSLVTSGVDQRFFEVDGKRYHHIINKDTLFPMDNYLSVSVCYSSSAVADALSTALFNMTIDEGRGVISSFPGAEVTYVLNDGRVEIIGG